MNNKELIFVDTETTGLNPAKHEIIEVAWLVTTPDAKKIMSSGHCRMLPEHIENAEPKALEVNGYTREKWASGPVRIHTHKEVAGYFWEASQRRILVGQNVAFDEGFLKTLLYSNGLHPSWHYHTVDTAALAWPAFAQGELPGLSLEKLCTFLQIPQEQKHAADADVKSCYSVYRALMHRYSNTW